MSEELEKMGEFMEPLLKIAAKPAAEKAAAETTAKTTVETERKSNLAAIRNMVKKLNLTVQEAMDILNIPAEKQKEYISAI